MGNSTSRPTKSTKPVPQSRRQTEKSQNQMKARLSRPFDQDAPLSQNQMKARLSRPFDANVPLYVTQEGQSSSRKRDQTARRVDPARYGDAYEQLTARSKKRAQEPSKEHKVQYTQGPRVKSQKAQFRGDTLLFSN